MTDNKHWIFLENLRRIGVTNMYGAGPYLEKVFGMDHDEAAKVLSDWMKNYDPNDYK